VNNFYVYEHWRLDRDECFYVGKGKGRRAYDMKYRNRHHNAIQAKVAREGAAIEVRMVAIGLTEEEAFDLECERIRFWRNAGIDLANMTDGGDGKSGYTCSEATKQKMSDAAKERNKNPEYIEKLRVKTKQTWETNPLIRERVIESGRARRGIKRKPTSEETKIKIGLANKGKKRKPASVETRKKISVFHFGKRCPEGTRAKISVALKGRKHSEDRKQKLRDAWVVRVRKPKKEKPPRPIPVGPIDCLGRSKAGPMKNAKRVICLDDNMSFSSASEAANFYKVAKSAIIELCLGKRRRKTVGKKKFAYEGNL